MPSCRMGRVPMTWYSAVFAMRILVRDCPKRGQDSSNVRNTVVFRGSSRLLSPFRTVSLVRCVKDRAHNLVVASASAQVAGQPVPHFLLGRFRLLIEQRLGRDNETGRANAALQ